MKASPKIQAVLVSIGKKESEMLALLDTYRNLAKSESVRLGITDRKTLTAFLVTCGDKDGRRVSEVAQFVFPNNEANRAVLDKVAEINANTTDNKKRIKKEVVMTIQRAKEPITLKEAQAIVAAKDIFTRQPGGKTDQTTSAKAKAKPKTAKEIDDAFKTSIAALVKEMLAEEYTQEDIEGMVTAEIEKQAEADAEADAEAEKDKD